MPDFREQFSSAEEGFRAMWAGLQRGIHTALISRVTKASDGHNVEVRPTVLQAVQDPTLTQTTYSEWPLLVDSPVMFAGGAGTTLTHGLAPGDETVSLFMRDPFDFWRQNSGDAQPVSDRRHSVSDHVTLPAVRSDPRRLHQVASDAMHARSDDKTAVHEVKPGAGIRSFHADPSTPPASDTFDPLTMATKFVHHLSWSSHGAIGEAVDGGTRHSHGSFHGIGSWLNAMAPSGLMQALAHPALGALISAADGKHSVTATSGGVMLQSATSISFDCPKGGLNFPAGGIAGGAIQTGGDLSGTLDKPRVVNLSNVVGQDQELVRAKSDAAAASAGVLVGELYVNVAVAQGVGLLAVRLV